MIEASLGRIQTPSTTTGGGVWPVTFPAWCGAKGDLDWKMHYMCKSVHPSLILAG